jgi:enoyl-CoA hydratase/carnithine racemase
MPEGVLYEKADGIATITLNRPERMNALPLSMWTHGLGELWSDFEADRSMRVAILTAAGERAFCAGVDVKQKAADEQARPTDAETVVRCTPLRVGVTKPVICAVNGLVGGGGLMLVSDCDVTIASANAQFFNPGVSVGLVALYGQATWMRAMPFHANLRMALMGAHERIGAERALELGLITEVVRDKPVAERAREIARTMLKNSPEAMRVCKKALWAGLEHGLGGAQRAVAEITKEMNKHPDFVEGARAFAEKRAPNWRDPR